MTNDYEELLSLRRNNGKFVAMSLNAVLEGTTFHSTYPVSEFYPEGASPVTVAEFEKAIDAAIEYIAPELQIGDCLVYGTKQMKWAMVALDFIPRVLAVFPAKRVPGRRLYLIMLPENTNHDYLDQCLDRRK